jgi:hypothetical protein
MGYKKRDERTVTANNIQAPPDMHFVLQAYLKYNKHVKPSWYVALPIHLVY